MDVEPGCRPRPLLVHLPYGTSFLLRYDGLELETTVALIESTLESRLSQFQTSSRDRALFCLLRFPRSGAKNARTTLVGIVCWMTA
jgi:hypothetical protein